MKKITALLLVLAMAAALCACGSSSSTPAADTAASDAPPQLRPSSWAPPLTMPPMSSCIPMPTATWSTAVSMSLSHSTVADYTGKELKVENMGFDYLLASLQKGDFDIVIAAMEATEERLNAADFSDPYYTDYPAMILIKADKADEYTSLDSFSGKAVAAQTATTKEDIVKNDMPGANLVSLQVVTDAVNQLVNDKVDAVVLDGSVAMQYAESNSDLVIADIELGEALPYCIAVAKGDPKGLLPGINEAIADMLKNNKVDEFIAAADELAGVAVEVTAEG